MNGKLFYTIVMKTISKFKSCFSEQSLSKLTESLCCNDALMKKPMGHDYLMYVQYHK